MTSRIDETLKCLCVNGFVGEYCEKGMICNRIIINYQIYNFLDCDWFTKLLFSTNLFAKLLSDSLLSDSSIIKPITFKAVV